MDEEEQRRNASAAAFGEADNRAEQNFMLQELTRVNDAARKRTDSAWANVKASIQNAVNAPYGTKRYDESGKNLDTQAALYDKAREESSMARAAWEEMQIDPSGAKGTRYPFAGQWERERGFGQGGNVNVAAEAYKLLLPDSTVPGASEAFGQLDAATPSDPTQFDERMAEGTQEGVADVLRQSFDENLKAARDAVAGQARRDRSGGEQRREGDRSSDIAQYRDRLLKMADQTLSGVGAEQNQPQDPYAAQREREALVAKRLGTFDLFSDAKTTRTPISAETIQTNAYDKVLMGKDNKDLFDSFL